MHCIYSHLSYHLGPLGQALDNMMGGNPNPTLGQTYNNMTGYGYRTYYRPAYGYQYLR